MGRKDSPTVEIEGLKYVSLATAARRAGLSHQTMKSWVLRGHDPTGHLIRTIERPNGKQLPIFVCESDVAKASRLPRNTSQVEARYDRKAIVIQGKRYLTPSQAASIFGMTHGGVRKWIMKGRILGFNLDVIRHGETKRKLISEECVLVLAAIYKDHPIKPGRHRGPFYNEQKLNISDRLPSKSKMNEK